MESGKRAVKRGLQLIVSTVARPLWAFPNESLVVLMYHRVLPENHPEWRTMQPGMVVSGTTLDLHLSILKEHFTLIHLSDWIRRARSGKPLPTRACAITFDDGWSDNYEFAYPILRRQQVPATIFLVSDYVNTNRRFWPERLAEALRTATNTVGGWSMPELDWLRALGVNQQFSIDESIMAVKVLCDSEINDRISAMEERLSIPHSKRNPHLMTWQQARAIAYGGLVEFGSHTRTHFRLGRPVGAELMAREIVGSKDALEEQLDRPVDLFCYPNGEISPAAENVVRRHYLAACSTKRGWNGADHDRHRLRRIGMHNDVSSDYHAFVSRLTGWL